MWQRTEAVEKEQLKTETEEKNGFCGRCGSDSDLTPFLSLT